MPTYDYVCGHCGHRFEVIHGVHAEGPVTCPSCGGGPVRKAFSAPTIHFKGTGWAKKDRSATSRPAASSAAASSGSTDGGSDAAGSVSGSGSGSGSGESGGAAASTTSDGGAGESGKAAAAKPAPAKPPSGSSAGD
jgi:putative FmdB family regulatory protein